MAKFKPARGKKKPMPPQKANAIGCIILISLLSILVFAALYYTVKQG